jgi:predicted nucleic acid-binding protein
MSREQSYMNGEPPLLDTNLLVYAYDESEGAKHEICKRMVDECWRSTRKYSISIQNLSEFYVIMTAKVENPVPEELAKEIVQDIIEFQNWKILEYDAPTILAAIDLSKEFLVQYWDALLAATMKNHGIFRIYTEDRAFALIPWLTVSNPFEAPL